MMSLLRSGQTPDPHKDPHMLYSSCELTGEAESQQRHAGGETYHVCRPGTGLYNMGLPGDHMPAKSEPSTTDATVAVGDGNY